MGAPGSGAPGREDGMHLRVLWEGGWGEIGRHEATERQGEPEANEKAVGWEAPGGQNYMGWGSHFTW